MKPGIWKFLLLGVMTGLVSGCASSGPPLAPSLELPRPVTDLRALRKGDKVYLAWTIPTQTTDHQSVRALGPTLICRSLAATMSDCGTPVAEVPASAAEKNLPKGRSAAPAGAASFVDLLPSVATADPREEATYAVKVLNVDHRGAGLSNLVREPSAPALPPPGGFAAQKLPRTVCGSPGRALPRQASLPGAPVPPAHLPASRRHSRRHQSRGA